MLDDYFLWNQQKRRSGRICDFFCRYGRQRCQCAHKGGGGSSEPLKLTPPPGYAPALLVESLRRAIAPYQTTRRSSWSRQNSLRNRWTKNDCRLIRIIIIRRRMYPFEKQVFGRVTSKLIIILNWCGTLIGLGGSISFKLFIQLDLFIYVNK